MRLIKVSSDMVGYYLGEKVKAKIEIEELVHLQF